MKRVYVNEVYKFPPQLGGYALVMRVDGEFSPTVYYRTADSTSIQSDNPELYQEFVAVMRHVATKLDASSKLHASYSFIRADGVEVSTEVEHTSTWQDTGFKAFKAFVRSEEIDGSDGCDQQLPLDLEDGGTHEDDEAFVALASTNTSMDTGDKNEQ